VHLTQAEAALLRALARRAGEALSREALSQEAQFSGNVRTVDVQMTRLRRKIEQDPKFPRYLQTVRGTGYVLKPD
jgi:two-component system, OmpR family, phosphate regulon response regulator OmpR